MSLALPLTTVLERRAPRSVGAGVILDKAGALGYIRQRPFPVFLENQKQPA
jgi:hypothetical protein